jgi:hypothetical protein
LEKKVKPRLPEDRRDGPTGQRRLDLPHDQVEQGRQEERGGTEHEREATAAVSATTPVGTSKSTWPTVKKALAAKASVLFRPATSRKRVLMPQMKDAASLVNRVSSR